MPNSHCPDHDMREPCYICLLEQNAAQAEQIKRLREGLIGLYDYADGLVCRHEDTHRGGTIWEICDFCGARWADDEGGKPEWEPAKEMRNAEYILKEASND